MLLYRTNVLIAMASRPVDGASAAVFRIVFGLLGLVGVIRFFVHGWISELYIQPAYHFKYLWFGWVPAWPAWGMYAHFAALGILSVFIAIGYRYRLSVALFFLGFTYVELIDKVTYLNHYYWVSLVSFLMIFMPLHRVASVDARRNPSIRRDTVPVWVIWVLRAQLAAVYFFAGIAKLNTDWLLNAQPLRIWLYQNGDLPLVGPLLQETWVAYAMSWAGAFFDVTIVAWLLWRRSRPIAYLAILVFHVLTWVLFPSIGMFPWLMIGGTLIFFSPAWPRRFHSWMLHRLESLLPSLLKKGYGTVHQRSYEKEHDILPHPSHPLWQARIAILGVGLFTLAQVVMPLRHFAYPGNVRWNEEGYRFSWRVMLTEKAGFVQFKVYDLATGQTWLVDPGEYLTPLQTERMAIQPDMILQTAHVIADDFAERGYRDVEVTADAFVSFNGRPNLRLINQDIDLADIEPGLAPKSWVLPFNLDKESQAAATTRD